MAMDSILSRRFKYFPAHNCDEKFVKFQIRLHSSKVQLSAQSNKLQLFELLYCSSIDRMSDKPAFLFFQHDILLDFAWMPGG